jgi:hypothetical protein
MRERLGTHKIYVDTTALATIQQKDNSVGLCPGCPPSVRAINAVDGILLG